MSICRYRVSRLVCVTLRAWKFMIDFTHGTELVVTIAGAAALDGDTSYTKGRAAGASIVRRTYAAPWCRHGHGLRSPQASKS